MLYVMTACEDRSEPGGRFINGMNLSGNPGIRQPIQMPPTFGQPPRPNIQPRFPMLTRAGSHGHDSPCLGHQAINPCAGGDSLARMFISAKGGLIPFVLECLVWDGSFDDQDEGVELTLRCQGQGVYEVITHFIGEKWVAELHSRDTRERSLHEVFDTGLGGACHRDGLAIATESGRDPENFQLFERLLAWDRTCHLGVPPPVRHPVQHTVIEKATDHSGRNIRLALELS